MKPYHVVIAVQDHRPCARHESKQITVNAGNARGAAHNALCQFGYGAYVKTITKTGNGEYTAHYYDLATFRLYPMRLENQS